MSASDRVKMACVECRDRHIRCINPTASTGCKRCTKNNIPCIMAPPTQGQRDTQRAHNARRPNELDSGSNIIFGPFDDGPESASVSDSNDASTNNIEDTIHPTKTTNPMVLVHRQRTTSALGKRASERAPSPSVNHSGHDSDQSDEMPLVKKRKCVHTPIPLREISTSTISTVSDESATDSGAQGRNPSTLGTLMVTLKIPSQYRINNTILQVCLSDSESSKPLLLKDYMQAFQLFAKMIELWSVTLDKVRELRIRFPWFPEGNHGRLLTWDRQKLQKGFTLLCETIKRAPCWTEGKKLSCVRVIIVLIQKEEDLPTTLNDRAIPFKVYGVMRADKQADRRWPVDQIASLLGIKKKDVLAAGEELKERSLISMSNEEPDVWTLSEG